MNGAVSALSGGSRGDESALAIAGVIATLGLHGAIIIAVIVSAMMPKKTEVKPDPPRREIVFDDVQLLKLGEELPKRQLPRIANPAPPKPKVDDTPPEPVKKRVVKPRKDAVALPSKKRTKKPAPKQPKQTSGDRQKAMMDALAGLGEHDPNRPVNNDKQRGSKLGVAGGTLSDAAKANLMAGYTVKLNTALSRYWTIPTTVPRDQIKQLAGQARVYVRLGKNGRIITFRWRKKTSNEQFNASIDRLLRSFQRSRKLPLPENAEVRQIVIQEGLSLSTWEYTGK